MATPAVRRVEPEPPPRRPARGSRAVRALLATVVMPMLLGLVIVLLVALTPWGNERVRRLVVSRINERLNGELAIGRLRGNLLTGATLTDVRLSDSLRGPLFAARRVQVRYALAPALRGRLVVRSLVLDTPVVVLDRPPGARWNFQSLVRPKESSRDTSSRGMRPELSDVTIRHGQLTYRRPWRPDSTLAPVRRDSAIARALAASSRSRTERVGGGFQRVLEYRAIDARLPTIELAREGRPLAVEIGALSMQAEPYRPPAIDVRSLTGTLFASKDSLWWRAARMALPASKVTGDGTIVFDRGGFRLDLRGAPLALADLRWLSPRLPQSGGGTMRYTMRVRGDTTELALADANLRYRDASVVGSAAAVRVAPRGARSELLVRSADLAVAGLTTSILRELAPSIPVRGTGTLDGRLAVRGPQDSLEVEADLRFDDAAAGRSHVVARGGLGTSGGLRARDLAVQLRPLRLATLTGFGVKVPLAGVLTGDATVDGSARGGWRARGDLTHVDGAGRSRVAGSGSYRADGGRIVADARLLPLSLTTVGRFAPDARLRGAVTGRVRAEGTTRDLRVAGSLRSTSGGGALDARGTVARRGARTRYALVATADALDAGAFSARAPSTRLTGRMTARGAGFAPATANALITADLASSRYDTFSVDGLRTRLALAGGLLRLDTLALAAGGARVGAAGSLGLTAARTGTMQFAATVDSLGALRRWLGTRDTGVVAAAPSRQRVVLLAARADSTRRADSVRIERLALGLPEGVALVVDTLPAVRRDSLAGRLDATGTLRGNVMALGIEAALRGTGLVARGSTVQRVSARVSGADVRGRTAPLAFDVRADTVEATGRVFESLQAAGTWSDRRLAAALRVRQDSLVSYAALGEYARPGSGVHLVRLDSLRAAFDTLVWRLTRPGAVRVDHGSVTIDSLELRSSAGGRLFAAGIVPATGPVALDVAVEEVRIGTLLRAMQRETRSDGMLAASARIEGTRAMPVATGRAALREARYRESRAPDVDVAMRYGERRLALESTARDSTSRQVLVAAASLPLDLALGAVPGSRRIDGPLTVKVALDSLSLDALPLRSRSFDEVRGRAAADVRVSGSWRAPEYAGHAGLRGAGVRLVSTGMRIADAVADVRLVGDTLRLDSLVARAGGPLRASGTVAMDDPARPYVRLTASGEDLRVMDALRGVVDADAEIQADGPLDALRVTGRGEMKGGYLALKQFRKDLLRVKSPGDLSYVAVFDTSAAPNDSLRLALARRERKRVAVIADLSLVIARGNYYRNRPDANTEFFTGAREEVRAQIDQRTDDQWAVGFVRIGGGVALFRTQPFVPQRGTLTFAPHTNAAGVVQQVGERLLWEPGRGWFPLQLFTGGTSKSPAIGLESGTLFPIRGRELNGYLTMGRSSTSLLQQAGSSLSGSASWSGQLSGESGALARRQQAAIALGVVVHDIGTGTTKEYGLDAFSLSPADVPTELVFGKTGGVRGALVEGGRYLTPERYVAGQLRLTTGIPGFRIAQRFGTTYRLDLGLEPRFLFRSPDELGITHPTIRTGVFGAFLTRIWDF